MATMDPRGWLSFSPGRNPDIKDVDRRLIEIVSAGAAHLPSGYRVTINEGYNPAGHVPASQHHIYGRGAIDVQIWTPDGQPIPNKGYDSTGLYRQLAQYSYGEMQARYPELDGKLAWGGSFPTSRVGQTPDLMHFDIGGERGTLAPVLSKLGAIPGVQYGTNTAVPARAAPMANPAQQVYSMLVQGDPAHGVAPLPPAIAAGAVGNMMQESGMQPLIRGAGGEIGIGQWAGPRYTNMVNWTKANGLDPTSLEGQALFYSNELQASPTMGDLANAKTAAEAAQIISTGFERPGKPMLDKRIAYANAVAANAPTAVASMATTPPDMTLKPVAAADVPAGPLGADRVVKAMIGGEPSEITGGWNKLVSDIIAAPSGMAKQVTDYFASPAVRPFQQAAAEEMAFNPDKWAAVPEKVGAFGIYKPLREPMQQAAEELVTQGHVADQAQQFGLLEPQRSIDYTNLKPVGMEGGQGEVPQETTWHSMAKAGQDALQRVADQPAYQGVGGAGVAPSMATTPPPSSGLTESMDYALHVSPAIEAAVSGGGVQPTAAPVTATPSMPAARPKPSMATQPPGGGGIGGRIYRAVAQPITQGAASFWSGPMHAPDFGLGLGGVSMPHSGGSLFSYQPNTGRTQTDQWGNRVNVGVYTDDNGNQHEYTWSPSGAP